MITKTVNLPILNVKGENVGRELDVTKINGCKFNEQSVYLTVKAYLANQRQGTHKTKGRSEVKGSTRKLYKQKGTGGARRGDIKSPLLRGGGTIFGPVPRDYSIKINKKTKNLAIMSALKSMLGNECIVIVDKFNVEDKKTKSFVNIMGALGMEPKKILIVIDKENENLVLSSRNLKNVCVKNAKDVNVYDIVSAYKVYFEEGAVKSLEERIKI